MLDLQDVLEGTVSKGCLQQVPYLVPFLTHLKEAHDEIKKLEILKSQLLLLVNELKRNKMTQKKLDPGKQDAKWNQYVKEYASAGKEKDEQVQTAKQNFFRRATSSLEKAEDGIAGLEQKLLEWQDEQRWAQIGPMWLQQTVIEKLDSLDAIFEAFEKGLKILGEGMRELSQPEMKDQVNFLKAKLQSQVDKLVRMSCIIAKMPPLLLKKAARPPRNTERPKKLTVTPDCIPIVRILGGKCLGIRAAEFSVKGNQIECCIVQEAEAKRIMEENILDKTAVDAVGKLTNATAKFEEARNGHFIAAFKHMALVELTNRIPGGARDRREDEAIRQRYYIIFFIPFSYYWGGTSFPVQKVIHSLPSAVVVGTKQKTADAHITWDLAFASGCSLDCIENVPRENSAGIPWTTAFRALDIKFQQLVEGAHPDCPLTPENSLANAIGPNMDFNDSPSQHLAEKLFFAETPPERYENCYMKWEQFFCVPNEYQKFSPGDPRIPAKDRDGRPCPFMEWFWKCAELVHRHLYTQWKRRLIIGFMGKATAEKLVLRNDVDSMILRFSDTQMCSLMITVRTPSDQNNPKHIIVTPENLENMSIARSLFEIQSLRGVDFIYPKTPKTNVNEDEGAQANGFVGGSSTNSVYFQRLTTTLLEVGQPWEPPEQPQSAPISQQQWNETYQSTPIMPVLDVNELPLYLDFAWSDDNSQYSSPPPSMDMEI